MLLTRGFSGKAWTKGSKSTMISTFATIKPAMMAWAKGAAWIRDPSVSSLVWRMRIEKPMAKNTAITKIFRNSSFALAARLGTWALFMVISTLVTLNVWSTGELQLV